MNLDLEESDDCLQLLFVGVYLTDRAYGGPEEGGWWYDCGELVTDTNWYTEYKIPLPTTFTDRALALKFAREVDALLKAGPNVGRRDKNSVLSQGVYETQVTEGRLPLHFPTERPHYE